MNYKIEATPNNSKRTFTIRLKYTDSSISKYRTIDYNKSEFDSMLTYTNRDWKDFIYQNQNEYSRV